MWNLRANNNCLLIVQSLRKRDWNTGARLFAKLQRRIVDGATLLPPALYEVPSAQAFVDLLGRLENDGRSQPLSPILHLEMHGDEDGISFSDGSRLAWPALASNLRPINGQSRNNLILVMAVCKGYHLLKGAFVDILAPCPYWGLVGAEVDLTEAQIEKSFEAFYLTLHQGNGRTALAAFAAASGNSFLFASAEQVFAYAFHAYVTQKGSARARLDRVEALVSGLIEAGMSTKHITNVRRRLKAEVRLEGQQLHYERLRREFLWIQPFPEIAPRFPLDFAAFLHLYGLREGDL